MLVTEETKLLCPHKTFGFLIQVVVDLDGTMVLSFTSFPFLHGSIGTLEGVLNTTGVTKRDPIGVTTTKYL